MSVGSPTPLLDSLADLADLRSFDPNRLPALAAEIRRELVGVASKIGGHLAASLGVVELTLALHRAFDAPADRLVWDIGHQAHVHKLLTGRRRGLATQRHHGGLAPFLNRDESEYDSFGAGHAGTAVSAAVGMAAAARLIGTPRRIVAILGDGALTSGMSFEALNHLGASGLPVLVILNDNDYGISRNVGALRKRIWNLSAARPDLAEFFDALGLAYRGPIDGHDLPTLEAALTSLRDAPGPQLLHVRTVKGRGYAPAEADPVTFHGVSPFDLESGRLAQASAAPTFSSRFGDWLCAAAERDPRLVAITPAMIEGSGLATFATRFPARCFDVGIAEQHALTLAAGMACEGLRPVVAIYSTFLQRGYDQLIHDIALQRLPVLLAIDRGGLVGPDGATHHGAFDLSFLRCVPNLAVRTPADGDELCRMLDDALAQDAGPVAIRYPRGPSPMTVGEGVAVDTFSARQLRRCESPARGGVAILNFGSLLDVALTAGRLIDATVIDMRSVKPLDTRSLALLAAEHRLLLVTLEDNVIVGGAGSGVGEWLFANASGVPLLQLGLPDHFVGHGSRAELLKDCGLDAEGVIAAIQARLNACPL